MPDIKEYLLINSDERMSISNSTTDFIIQLPVPITNVVKTDLIQVSMDYNVANITQGEGLGANNSFTVGNGNGTLEDGALLGGTSSTIILEEGLYTVDVLASWIRGQLVLTMGPGWEVFYDTTGKLMIQYVIQEDGDVSANRVLSCGSPVLCPTLGLTLSGGGGVIEPTLSSTDSAKGTYRWYFPYPVNLSGIYPYLFIQSRTLGTDIRTANNTLGFWRMILNDPVNYQVSMVNNRVDTYQRSAINLQQIDVRLIYPDGGVVNNNGGRFTMLLEIIRRV
jgi:hypothetical protein